MSISKVAKLSGVSKSTVSRVLNGESNVAPGTWEKVISAVEKTGYKLPESGRCGRPKKNASGIVTGNIMVIFPYEEPREESPLTARLIYGFTQAIEKKGLNLVLGQFSPTGDPPAVLERISSDAVIVRPGTLGREIAQKLKIRVPSVWLFEQGVDSLPRDADNVLPDNTRAGEMAARYFVEKGFQSMVVVNPFLNHACCNTRVRMFRETAGKYDCKVFEINWDSTVEALAKKTIETGSLPAGIFVPNGLSGFYQALYVLDRDLCLKSGWLFCQVEKQQLVGVGNHVACMDMRFEDIAEAAVETALWRLSNPKKPPRRVMISPEIL